MPEVSVIVGAYNHLQYLKLCLFSLERQSFRDFEVIIADDGSGPEVGEWLGNYKAFFPVKHLWQEDNGFRKCRILNRSILESKGNYIVFLDADCIMARDFLQVHWSGRKQGIFLGGRRVMMDQLTSANVSREMISRGYFDGLTPWGLYQTISGHMKYYEESIRLLYNLRKNSPFSLLGCNFSIHKPDLRSINGFDESYEHRGGGEDTDICYRLKLAGFKMESVRYRAIQFHLGHEKPESKDASAKIFEEKRTKLRIADDARDIKSLLSGYNGDEDTG